MHGAMKNASNNSKNQGNGLSPTPDSLSNAKDKSINAAQGYRMRICDHVCFLKNFSDEAHVHNKNILLSGKKQYSRLIKNKY